MSFALSYYPDQGFFYFQIRSSKCIDWCEIWESFWNPQN
jgi:hypothetical protein